MLRFVTHNFVLFKREEIWFYRGETIENRNYISFSAAKRLPGGSIRGVHKYNSAVIDLKLSEEILFSRIHSRLQYDLKLAEKKSMEFHAIETPGEEECMRVLTLFNEFAKSKGIVSMNKEWISSAARTRKLVFTKITHGGQDVVYHIFLFNEKEMLNTHSFYNVHFTNSDVSKFANKFLHWQDILYFKMRGFDLYSFGPIPSDPELKGIMQFKMNYGSSLEENYRLLRAPTLLFKLLKIAGKSTS